MSQAESVHTTIRDLVAEQGGGEPLLEPAMVTDVFVSDLAAIDSLGGGITRLIFTTLQRGYGGSADNVVVAKLVVPASVLVTMAVLLAQAEGRAKSPPKLVAANTNTIN